jgi:endonuclease/exonuclease/phosphatase family metal-dependent hydrolase
VALAALACEPLAVQQTADREPVAVFKRSTVVPPKTLAQPAQLRVVAWNMKYGAARVPFWFDCWGDRVQMSKAEVEANLKQVYALLDELDPDVLMVEEIEVNSKRSAYVDMVRGILENTQLNYAAYYGTWNSQYVAAEGVGRIDLGNAIFSKYPISKAESIRQADRTDQDPLTQMFYIHRAIGRAEIELRPGERVAAYVVHTEAYDNDGTKQKQIQQIYDVLKAEKLPRVVGGDFNELPPSAARVQGFADERETSVCSEDFKQPPYTPQVMQKFYDDFVPWVPLDRYGALEHEQQRYFTHSVLGPDDVNDKGDKGFWNRTLDYLFVSQPGGWVQGSTDVVQQAGQRIGGDKGTGPVIASDVLRLSDHAPVIGTWEVRP